MSENEQTEWAQCDLYTIKGTDRNAEQVLTTVFSFMTKLMEIFLLFFSPPGFCYKRLCYLSSIFIINTLLGGRADLLSAGSSCWKGQWTLLKGIRHRATMSCPQILCSWANTWFACPYKQWFDQWYSMWPNYSRYVNQLTGNTVHLYTLTGGAVLLACKWLSVPQV